MNGWDRRTVLGAAAAMAAVPGAAFAKPKDRARIMTAVEAAKAETIERLRAWIAYPTIAAEKLNVDGGAPYMAKLATEAGFQRAEVVPTSGVPGVFATYDVGAKRTLGVYFMYDVKQYDPAEWSSPPLEGRLVERPGMGSVMIGRGAINQKGPETFFLAALHAFRQAGVKLPVNLVLVAEGEEEIGSPNFHEVARRPDVMAALKKCEGIFIPTAWQDPTTGAAGVNLGAKGIVELELVASGEKWGRGPKTDIHSSLKATVDSPAWRLVQALQTLVTPDGNTPAIDGWFENVRPLTAREKALIAETARTTNEADVKRRLGVPVWIDGLPYEKALERLASEPTVNIEGLVSGYTGPGGKTVLPGRAVAKIDLRLVPNQTRAEAERKLRAHLDKRGFPDVEVNVSGGYDPTETAEDSRIVQSQLAAYKQNGVKATLNPRLAGSWPGSVFTQPPVSLPAGQFGLGHGGAQHAPDEYLVIDSANPKVMGLTGSVMGFVDLLYAVAAVK